MLSWSPPRPGWRQAPATMLARVLVRTDEGERGRPSTSARRRSEAAAVLAGHGWFLEALELAGPMLASYEHGDERFWEQALTGTLRHVCQAWCLAHRRPPSLADISAAIGEPARLRELVSGAGAAAWGPSETARARALVGWYRNNWTEMPALNPFGLFPAQRRVIRRLVAARQHAVSPAEWTRPLECEPDSCATRRRNATAASATSPGTLQRWGHACRKTLADFVAGAGRLRPGPSR